MRIWSLGVGMVVALCHLAFASPFVPLEWQTPVETGPLAGQRKHVGWIRDLNGDFIDDAFDVVSSTGQVDVIVQLSECHGPGELRQKLSAYGAVVSTGTLVAYAVVENVPKGLLDDLARKPYVAALEKPTPPELDLDVSTRGIRARTSSTYPTSYDSLPGAGDGTGITVAVVDTGVDDLTHKAFAGKFVAGYDFSQTPPKPGNPVDTEGHGTGVAGIVLGIGVGSWEKGRTPKDETVPTAQQVDYNDAGVAPGAKLIDVKIPEGDLMRTAMEDALEWIYKDGRADIVNVSASVGTFSKGQETISQIINALVAKGVHVVVSAGNKGYLGSSGNFSSLAAADGAIAVANAYDNRRITRDAYGVMKSSSFGPRIDFNPNSFDALNVPVGMLKPDLAAPGFNIYVPKLGTQNEYETWGGTSFAAPHVAGAIALLLSLPGKSDVPPESMKELLKQTAFKPSSFSTYLGIPNYDVRWGAGFLDVAAAAQALQSGVADITFPTALEPSAKHDNYPEVRRCKLKGNRPSYANDVDIVLKYDPPEIGALNEITVKVENRTGVTAKGIVVYVGVKDFGVGTPQFYDVGTRTISQLGAGKTTSVTFPWVPKGSDHQCIQATIAYPYDMDFSNNVTQRNVQPKIVNSPVVGTFLVENPLREPATIVLEVLPDSMGHRWYTFELEQSTFELRPEDCPVLNSIHFQPMGSQVPLGTAIFDVSARAYNESHQDGIELSGVVFKLAPAMKSVCWVCTSIYDTLVSVSESGVLSPRLAKQWDVDEEGTSYTFYLREGVVFHDGTLFRSDAVLHNLEDQVELLPGITREPLASKGGIEEIELVDDYTVRIHVSHAGVDLLQALSGLEGMIASPSGTGCFVGTGPFRLAHVIEPVHAVRADLLAFSGYWGELAGVAEVNFVEIADESTLLTALQAGEIDIAVSRDPDTFAAIARLLPDYVVCGTPDQFQVFAPWVGGFACHPEGRLLLERVIGVEQLRIGVPSLW